jgi:hypothetical protein
LETDNIHAKAVCSAMNFNKNILPSKSKSTLLKAMPEGNTLHKDYYNIITEIWNPMEPATTVLANIKATSSYIFVRYVQTRQVEQFQQIFSLVREVRNVRFTSYGTAVLELDTMEKANTFNTILTTKLRPPNNNLECEHYISRRTKPKQSAHGDTQAKLTRLQGNVDYPGGDGLDAVRPSSQPPTHGQSTSQSFI